MTGAATGFLFPHERNAGPEELLFFARLADQLGYDSLFMPESWYREAFGMLGWLAAQTTRIRLGTGIANVFSRTPALLAQAVATLDMVSDGRAFVGLGTSGPAVVENWHGLHFDRALQRTRETVAILRMALAGERVDYDGQIFKVKGFRLGVRPVQPRVPIYVASLGPQNNRLTGEIADGWLPIWLPVEGFRDALAEVRSGRTIASPLLAAPVVMCCAGAGREPYDLVRSHMAYYVGGMGTFYRNVVSRFGMADVAGGVHELWQAGKRKEAIATVTDEMIDRIAAAGTPVDVKRKLEMFRNAGADMPVVAIPHGTPPELVKTTLEAAV